MKKEFVPYDQSLALKELGFDERCFGYYVLKDSQLYYDTIIDRKDNVFRNNASLNYFGDLKEKVAAPLKQQVFRWFREKYDWTIKVNQVTKNNWSYTLDNFPKDRTYYGEVYKTYEEAESACIDKLIEIYEKEV